MRSTALLVVAAVLIAVFLGVAAAIADRML